MSEYSLGVDWAAGDGGLSVEQTFRRGADGRALLVCGRAVEKSTSIARKPLSELIVDGQRHAEQIRALGEALSRRRR